MDARRKDDTANTADREMVITRIIDAPRELVWEAMTNPEHVVHWWGPNGFTNTLEKMDFRVGGVWKHVMHGPDGKDYPNFSTFTAIVKPERIEFLHGGRSKGDPDVQFDATWTFEALGNQTRVTIRAVFPTVDARDTTVKVYNAIEGGNQTLARLADYLPKVSAAKADLVITCIFDAPRALVWKAWTDPEQVAQWWGPQGFTNPVCELDVRAGGAIRIDMRAPDGTVYPMTGVFREIIETDRLVFTSYALDTAGKPMFEVLNTVTFAEQGGKTTQTVKVRVVNKTAMAGRYLAGMETGWTQSLVRLDALLR